LSYRRVKPGSLIKAELCGISYGVRYRTPFFYLLCNRLALQYDKGIVILKRQVLRLFSKRLCSESYRLRFALLDSEHTRLITTAAIHASE
jgi:hypothetical protein